MIQFLFIFTALITIFNAIGLLSIMFGNGINLPGFLGIKSTEPGMWYIIYPCTAFQVWFWTQPLFS